MFGNAEASKQQRPDAQTSKKASPDEIAATLSVGIVLHDNQSTMSDGWAFLPDQPPFRIRGLFDLPNNSLWISSGDFQDFRKLGGTMMHHVRRTGYLGLKITEIAADLGVRIDGCYAQEGGRRIVNYVQEAVRLAVRLYKLDDPLRQLQEDTLVTTIAKALPPPPASKELMVVKLSSAYQSWSSRYVPFTDNTVNVRLRFSRVWYASRLLENPVPDNGWSHVFSASGFDHDAVLAGTFSPTLIEAVLELDSVSVEIAELIAYGTGTMSKQRSKRTWMTDVEYRWISQFARIHVQSYLMAISLSPIPSPYCLPKELVADEFLDHQVSAGLVAYAHWQALVSTKYSRLTGKNEHDLYGTWLRAHDRAMCFKAAFCLQSKGFPVTGYGNGSVIVRADKNRLTDLADAAMNLGFAFPKWNALLQEFGYASPDYSD